MGKKTIGYILLSMIIFMISLVVSILSIDNSSIEEQIEKVLSTTYENQFEEFKEKYPDPRTSIVVKIDEKRRSKVKKYFTDDGYENITTRRFLTNLHSFIVEYQFSSFIDDIKIDIRETNDPNTMVCYYDLVVKLIFQNEEKKDMTVNFSGSMSLHKENNNWLIGTIIDGRLFNEYLRKQLDKHK